MELNILALIENYKQNGYFIAYLDGKSCPDKQKFLVEIGKSFNFPNYYGENLDALADCINDLGWLQERNYVLYIHNSDYLLKDETENNKRFILDIVENARFEWSNVPNHEGEQQFRDRADFVIITERTMKRQSATSRNIAPSPEGETRGGRSDYFNLIVEEPKHFDDRLNLAILVEFIFALLVVVFVGVSGNWFFAFFSGAIIFIVQYFKAVRSEENYILEITFENGIVEIKYKKKNTELSISGEVQDFFFKRKIAFSKVKTTYMEIYFRDKLLITQYEIGKWNESMFKDVIKQFEEIKTR